MAPAIPLVIAFFALIVWRVVFNNPLRRVVVREIDAPRKQDNSFLEQGFHILERVGMRVIAGNRFEGGSDSLDPVGRAKTYLRRIVALTGATQLGNSYVLDVGTTRFHVRNRYVGRVRDVTDPKCKYEETCFYSAQKEMPKSEHIATALLQLKTNPALFDKWAAQSGAFKADGLAFSPAQ